MTIFYVFRFCAEQLLNKFDVWLHTTLASVAVSESPLFKLVVDMGFWFPCCALGCNTRTISFTDNTHAAVYFGSARSAPQSQGFLVYAFLDSVIITTSHNDVRVSKRVDVSTRD